MALRIRNYMSPIVQKKTQKEFTTMKYLLACSDDLFNGVIGVGRIFDWGGGGQTTNYMQ